MGRPERPVDPAAGPVPEFAAELRRLRERAGRPSYRELARRASLSVTVLSEAAGGRSLPTLAVVRGYARACGGDVAEWEERWRRAADLHRDESADDAPYLGLASYGEEHAGLFFGREALTADLIRRLAARRFLAVFGASGSGKSSLLRAGVLAAVNRGDLDCIPILLTPGEQPVTALASRFADLAGTSAEFLHDEVLTDPMALHNALVRALSGRPAGTELLLVVDQFEELFSACRDPLQRDCFVRALLAAVDADDARARVLVSVRADFYAHCARWPALVAALRDAQVLVGPMDLDQLHDVIVKPAEQAGMTVESALVATALGEIGAESGIEPGALALVSHALLETWRYSPRGRLTLRAYQEAGGVRNAIADTAERVYADRTESQRLMLRRILLRLVAVGDGHPDTRRRVPPAELTAGDDPATTAALIETLVRARLLTIDDGSVQLAHEALIRFWPRLAEWLAEGRDGLRVQRQVSDAASEWIKLGRDPAALYRGTRLALARAWADRNAGLTGLTAAEREFLDASSAAEVRAARRMRRLVTALVILLTVVTAAGVVAGWQRESALSAERAAISGQLASQSAALAPTDPDAAALAAVAAWQGQPSIASRSALLDIAGCCTSTQTTLRGGGVGVSTVALSTGGQLLAAGGAGDVVYVWRTMSGRQQRTLRGPAESVQALAFSPRGKLLAGAAGHTIWLWNPVSGAVVEVLSGDAGDIDSLAFSPDGGLLASASDDGEVRLWLLTGHPMARLLQRSGKPMRTVAFSPDGGVLAGAGSGGIVTMWRVASPENSSVVRTLHGATASITNLAYSPTGTMIAAEEAGGVVLLWHLSEPAPTLLPACGGASGANQSRGLAFDGNGTVLLVAGGYAKLHLCDPGSGRDIADEPYQTPGRIIGFAYDPDSGSLALATHAGSVRYWRQPIPPFTGITGGSARVAAIPRLSRVVSVSNDDVLRLWNDDGDLMSARTLPSTPRALAVSPDGKLLAITGSDHTIAVISVPDLRIVRRLQSVGRNVSFSPDGHLLADADNQTVRLWNTTTWIPGLEVQVNRQSGSIEAMALGRGGLLAASTSAGEVIMWNIRTGKQMAAGHQGPGPVSTLAFSPDGQRLAMADGQGSIILWDPARLNRLEVLDSAPQPVWSLAFSPDGRTLASGSSDGSIRMWNLTERALTATLTSQGIVRTLAFTADGETLLSGSSRIIAWDLDPRDLVRQVCRTLASDPGLGQAEALVPDASYARLCPSR